MKCEEKDDRQVENDAGESNGRCGRLLAQVKYTRAMVMDFCWGGGLPKIMKGVVGLVGLEEVAGML